MILSFLSLSSEFTYRPDYVSDVFTNRLLHTDPTRPPKPKDPPFAIPPEKFLKTKTK
jgi:hypothetical protein